MERVSIPLVGILSQRSKRANCFPHARTHAHERTDIVLGMQAGMHTQTHTHIYMYILDIIYTDERERTLAAYKHTEKGAQGQRPTYAHTHTLMCGCTEMYKIPLPTHTKYVSQDANQDTSIQTHTYTGSL